MTVPRLDSQLLSDLWVFRVVGRCGSVTGAARELNVTQGAVSQRIARLESRLGVALFARHKGRLTLTSVGAELLISTEQGTQLIESGLGQIERAGRQQLVISCSPSLANEWLVPRLDDFYASHRNIELFVRAELSPITAARMADERIDIAIQYMLDPVPGLHELATYQEMIFPVCSHQTIERLGAMSDDALSIVRLHDQEPWPGARRDEEWQQWLQFAPDAWRQAAGSDRSFNLAHLAYHAAMFDQGIAMGRAVTVHRLLAKRDLAVPPGVSPAPGAFYRVLSSHRGHSGSPKRLLAAWLGRELENTAAATLALIDQSSGEASAR